MAQHTKRDYCVSRDSVLQAYKDFQSPASSVRRTPVMQGSRTLIPPALKSLGCELYFKLEMFQRSGSFKFRGASNAVGSIKRENDGMDPKDKVVVTVSSGNFAQGAALAAQNFGLQAKIVMPENTTKIKVDAVRSYGAEVEFCHPNERDEHCALVVQSLKERARFIHPSEDPRVIAGNGTLCVEFIEQVDNQFGGQKLDVIVVPVGGGGVISGVAAYARSENIMVVGAEPILADDAYRSKLLGSIQGHRIPGQTPNTVAEGLRTTLGPNTFPVVRDFVHSIIPVSEEGILRAMRLIFERLKCVAEASSCVAYAALDTPEFLQVLKENFAGKARINIGIVLTGGNVDFDPYFNNLSKY